MYLKIENKGYCDTDALLMLGVSTTRNSTKYETIGMFGSGTKHAICVMLREGIRPIIFINQMKMEFFTKNRIINGVSSGQNVNVVAVKLSGKDNNGKTIRTEKECGFVQEFGEIDWTEIGMGLREFVSNALDASNELDAMSDLSIELVDDNQVRARSGFTRVFVLATPEVSKFYSSLGSRFLHFTHSDVYNNKLMQPTSSTGKIYRRGVLVGDLETKSLFDYNFRDVQLDESRNIKEYTAINAAGNMLAKASIPEICKFIKSTQSEEKYWEHGMMCYNISLPYYEEEQKSIKSNWQEAWKETFGEDAIMCRSELFMVERLKKKGYRPISVPNDNLFDILQKFDIPTHITTLDSFEQRGFEYDIAPESLMINVNKIWNKLWAMNLTNGKEMPRVVCFTKIVDEEQMITGFYDIKQATIFINKDLICENEEGSIILNKVILEELSHHITGAKDLSRDFQDFILRIAVKAFE